MIEYHNNSNCGGTPHDFALLITNILMAKMYIFVHYIMLCKIICYHIVGMAAILKNGWYWLPVWNIGWLTFYYVKVSYRAYTGQMCCLYDNLNDFLLFCSVISPTSTTFFKENEALHVKIGQKLTLREHIL